MLYAVLVAGDQAPADSAVIGVLTGPVEHVRVAVEPFDDLSADRGPFSEPDRGTNDEDVGC